MPVPFSVPFSVTPDQVWRATSALVWVAGQRYVLVVAINEATAEVKYLVSNATSEPVSRLLAVAFRRATIEHGFRVGKQEVGLMHYEGRQYQGLIRHLILALIVLGFVALHTERLRGEKSTSDLGAGLSSVERALCDPVSSPPWRSGVAPCGCSDPIPPAAQRAGDTLTQETAA